MRKKSPYSIFHIPYSIRGGQSLVEVLVAVAIGVLMITAAAGIIAPVLKVSTQTSKAQAGAALAKELLDNVKVWAEGDWHNISALATSSAYHYYLNTASSPFASSSGNESVIISTTTYTRYFYVDDVYRDTGDSIVNATSVSTPVDPSTKQIAVAYNWPQGVTGTLYEYVTRNANRVFVQTDWSGGSGQEGPATSTNGRFSTSSLIDNTTTTGSIYVKF